jgi:hypothetical protein
LSTYESAEFQPEQPGNTATSRAGSSAEASLPAAAAHVDEPVAGVAVSEPIPARSAPATTTGSHRAARSGLRERLIVMREKAKEERHRRDRRRREGFHWSEREWDSRFWATRLGITPHTVLTVSLVIVVGLFVFLIGARAASRAAFPGTGSTKRQNANPIIIQQEGNNGDTAGSSTPSAPAYILGVWVSSMSPAGSGVEQVYVRVTETTSTDVNEPVPNVKVQVTSPYGVARSISPPSPAKRGGKGGGGVAAPSDTAVTDANGLATFNFYYGAGPGAEVYVFATATVNGKQISSNTVFVAG